ncbi:MAG: hypothetical protein A3K61_04545 [Thaumarchaeota archaeon RBG_16_49_8]|nr:MAG: hypothetical protein A3K61_04545 [Thaumarchaeota archaeon RBG_16_49_8]
MDDSIPKLYETESVPFERKIIHRRYQLDYVGFYWLIAELDRNKNLAFGYANLNDDQNAERGYVSIEELLENGAEIDRKWKPCTYREAMESIRKERRVIA